MKKNYILSTAILSFLSLGLASTAYAGQWRTGVGSQSGRWWYSNSDGSYPASEWQWIDGNGDGIAECYYFDAEGWLVTSQTIDGSMVNAGGAWVDGAGNVNTKRVSSVISISDTIEDGSVANAVRATSLLSISSVIGSDNIVEDPEGVVLDSNDMVADKDLHATVNHEEEQSTGVIELFGSDLDLGTELETTDYTVRTALAIGNASTLEATEDTRSSTDNTEEEDSTTGPGIRNLAVLVDEEPEEAKTVATTTTNSTKGSAAPYAGNVGSSADEMPRSEATALVEYARQYIGVLKYVSGGTSLTRGADCSGFTQQVFKQFGISIPRDSRSQYAASEKISVEELQPGDLIFYGSSPSTIYHVGIYSGNGTIVHCTHTGDYVREHTAFYKKPYAYGRFTN